MLFSSFDRSQNTVAAYPGEETGIEASPGDHKAYLKRRNALTALSAAAQTLFHHARHLGSYSFRHADQ